MALYTTLTKKINRISNRYYPKTIVLDLDETLISTHEDQNKLFKSDILTNPEFFPIRKNLYCSDESNWMWGIKRPHLSLFLDTIYSNFENVVVWSAGEYNYVYEMVDILFKYHPQPDLILTRDDCVYNHTFTEKPLVKVYDSLRRMGRYASPHSTIIIDDRQTNFNPNPDNGILIPRFFPDDAKDFIMDDPSLHELSKFLSNESFQSSADVRPFTKLPIFSKFTYKS